MGTKREIASLVTVETRLPQATAERLKSLAVLHDRSVAAEIRVAVNAHLKAA